MRRRDILMLAALAVLACGPAPRPEEPAETIDVPLGGLAALDVLILVDNSGSMAAHQGEIAGAIGQLFDAIAIDGALPDLRVGVATSDLGTLGVPTGVGECDSSDGGALQPGTCGIAGAFLADGAAGANYGGALAEAVGCMVQVGSTGCGFEQHLEAMLAALTTTELLRDEADLAVLILGDEDDCSAASPVFYAALPENDFKCFAEGVRCDPDEPGTAGAKLGCESREDSPLVHPVQRCVDALTTIKSHPARVSAGVIAAPPEPVAVVELGSSQGVSLAASCGDGAWRPAPAIRLAQLARGLGGRGAFGSICDPGYPVLAELGALVRQSIARPPCFAGAVEATCDVELVVPDQADLVIDACDRAASNPPCWRIDVDPVACPDGAHHELELVVAAPLPAGARLRATCVSR